MAIPLQMVGSTLGDNDGRPVFSAQQGRVSDVAGPVSKKPRVAQEMSKKLPLRKGVRRRRRWKRLCIPHHHSALPMKTAKQLMKKRRRRRRIVAEDASGV